MQIDDAEFEERFFRAEWGHAAPPNPVNGTEP